MDYLQRWRNDSCADSYADFGLDRRATSSNRALATPRKADVKTAASKAKLMLESLG